ncbi:aminotransferase class III-fold pyridoxal phosphate-dependent enzyme [Nostoc sp. UHCC 0251]|uniref:aminotransferase class III-fold pyridoxal phosphate-dependent enzyme n=1 Tax=Nostoc sp. UHCC 0251 TaxID=3110240 RepID=UPI002B21B5F4|nr:aminotransferase class III-fold pyridoxal phosphate-dependent enzyme [Nostoc sp. UHCC 0251]MEA5621834.1 aminotransferase class III-fold pyridoxal phosphate-dependent enzyme [Nostoc sp. UHCC 0251]
MIILRFISSFFVTIYYFLGYWFTALGKTDKQRRLLRSQWIYKYILVMGPLYIKMGQILATRSDLIDDELSTQLRQLQDDAPPSSEEYIRQTLKQELKRPVESVFETFFWKPVASASIAQVHEAVLTSGQRVAVKIVKKNVREQLAENLKIVRLCLKLAHALLPSIRYLNLPIRFEELYTLLLVQTDLKQEAENQETVYANFKGHTYVYVPMLIPELCTDNMLVMEFMEGIRGKDSHLVDLPASHLARRLQETIYTMLYMDGFCHGDPHPGNIFFTKTGEIILLDYGITVQLSEDEKWGLSSFYYACTRKEWSIAVNRFTQYFVTNKSRVLQEWEAYQQEMTEVLKLHFDERNNRWSTISYFQDVNKVLRRYEAQYTTNFTKVELVFLSCEGFISQIDPEIDIWANARKFTDRFSPYMNSAVKANFDRYFAQTSNGSLQLRDRAKQSLVAPTHLDRYFFPSTYPLFVKNAVGSKIEDVDGNVYIDLSCGYGPHILGYAHPIVTKTITEAVHKGGVNALGHLPEVLLAETLVQAFPSANKAIFSNSGTEAVLQAIRLCRAYRKRERVAKFEGHYHGFSDQGMVSSWFRFTGSKEQPEPIDGSLGSHQGIVKGTLVLQYGQALSLERIYEARDQLACVICEPMPVMMGAYDQEFLLKLRNLCTDYDIPLVFDEVVSGFRVTYGGVQNLANVSPDLTCLGKIIGGGLPGGSVVGKEKLINIAKSSEDPFLDYETKTFVGGTMSGNSLTCSAGLAVLNYLHQHPEIYTQLEEKTNWLAQEFREIAQHHNVPFKIKANYSIFAFSFSYKSTKLYREKLAGSNFKANLALAYYMRKHGVYIPELHTLMLNAAHTLEDLRTVTNAFDQSLREMVTDNFFIL